MYRHAYHSMVLDTTHNHPLYYKTTNGYNHKHGPTLPLKMKIYNKIIQNMPPGNTSILRTLWEKFRDPRMNQRRFSAASILTIAICFRPSSCIVR